MLTDSFTKTPDVDSPEAIKADIQAERQRQQNHAESRNGDFGDSPAEVKESKSKKKASTAIDKPSPFKNKQEALEATARFNDTKHAFRVQLLELHDRKAHKLLGYTDDFSGFCTYAAEKLDIHSSAQSILLQIKTAQVSKTLTAATGAPVEVPIAVGRQLAAVTPEKQIAIWNEYSAVPDIEKRSAAQMEPGIKRLVAKAILENPAVRVNPEEKRGKVRKEAQEGTQEPRTDKQESGEDNPSFTYQTPRSEVPEPIDKAFSLDDWQVEVGACTTLPFASNTKTAFDQLKQEVDFMGEFFYDTDKNLPLGNVFLLLVNLANQLGASLEEQAIGMLNPAEPVVQDASALIEAGYDV